MGARSNDAADTLSVSQGNFVFRCFVCLFPVLAMAILSYRRTNLLEVTNLQAAQVCGLIALLIVLWKNTFLLYRFA